MKKLLEKISKLKEEGGYGLQELLDKGYDGHCPCFSAKFQVDGVKCEVWGRCWRVSEEGVQDLHVFMPKELATAIKDCLDAQEWYNPYTLIVHRKAFL